MAAASMWPEFQAPDKIDSPAFLLKETAAALKRKTNGLVRAGLRPASTPQGDFWVGFDPSSPALGEYVYRLFEVIYPPRFFPLTFIAADKQETIGSPEQFRAALSNLLHSPHTKQIVEAIMAQATVLGNEDAVRRV